MPGLVETDFASAGKKDLGDRLPGHAFNAGHRSQLRHGGIGKDKSLRRCPKTRFKKVRVHGKNVFGVHPIALRKLRQVRAKLVERPNYAHLPA